MEYTDINSKLKPYRDLINKLGELSAELNEAVKCGQSGKAKTCLAEILTIPINDNKNTVEHWKHYVNMFINNLRSSAVAGGLDLTEALLMSQGFIKEVNELRDVDSIKQKAYSIVGEYAQAVFENQYNNCSKTVKEICRYINDNYDKAMSTKILAEAFHVNASHLSRQFKKEMFMTLTEYIHQIRIEEAKRLLKTKRYTVTQIAHMVGYNDVQYFTNTFKKKEQITPTEYITTQ